MKSLPSKSIIAPAMVAAKTNHRPSARANVLGLAVFGLLGLGIVNHATATNLLVNGSFESPVLTSEYGFIEAGNPSATLPGWNVPQPIYWLYRNFEGLPAQDGSQWFGPIAATGDLASQDFPVTAGVTYEVSWYSQYRADYNTGTGTVAITLAAGAATGTTTMTTAADASWTRYSFSFTPDTSTTATLTLSAVSGIPYFDNVAVVSDVIDLWYVNSTESWSGPRWVTGDWNIGQLTPGILNHTGGTITETTPWAFLIGQFATGTYHMSGNAGVITSGGTDTRVLVGNENQGTWSMIDNSTATVGQLLFNSPAGDTLLLAGNATVNAGDISFASSGSDYISISSGSAATLTVAGKVLSDYQAYVSAGNIRVDGVIQADFSKFVVTGNTLSLAPSGAPVVLSSWKFDSGADPNARLASSDTVSGLTVSQLNFHPTFDSVGFVNNDPVPLETFSTHDRWAADNGINILRMRRADYTTPPSGRSATYDSNNTSISNSSATSGAPIWFSVTTGLVTGATIQSITLTNPGGGSAATYHFSKSGDPIGTGVLLAGEPSVSVQLPAPITLAADETAYFSINIDGALNGNNINQIDLLGSTEAVPPPIGYVTGTLTVAPPHGTYNRMSVTLDPGPLDSSTSATSLTGTINATVNIDPATGKTPMLTLSGRVNGTNMSFVKTVPFVPLLSYNIQATNLSAAINTIAPPGTVNPDTGVFAANQHNFILDQGTFTGTAATQAVNYSLSATRTLAGIGNGNGTLTLTPAGTSGAYKLFNAVVILPMVVNQTIDISGVATLITGSGTLKATGQIQMVASEFNAWMLAQGATSFDPNDDTAGNGAPDGIKWALGLSSRFDNPLSFLLKPNPTAPGTFTITLPPGGTVAPLTLESSTNLLPPWTALPAGQMAPGVNPVPAGSTGVINITPTTPNKLFLRMRANP